MRRWIIRWQFAHRRASSLSLVFVGPWSDKGIRWCASKMASSSLGSEVGFVRRQASQRRISFLRRSRRSFVRRLLLRSMRRWTRVSTCPSANSSTSPTSPAPRGASTTCFKMSAATSFTRWGRLSKWAQTVLSATEPFAKPLPVEILRRLESLNATPAGLRNLGFFARDSLPGSSRSRFDSATTFGCESDSATIPPSKNKSRARMISSRVHGGFFCPSVFAIGAPFLMRSIAASRGEASVGGLLGRHELRIVTKSNGVSRRAVTD